MKIRSVLICFALIIILSLSTCKFRPDCCCTEIFMMQMVQLQDPEYQPIEDATITVTFAETGIQIDCSPYHNFNDGYYCILNDSFLNLLDVDGKEIVVKFQKTGFQARIETYLFNTDPCKCHINLLGGKTTVILQPV